MCNVIFVPLPFFIDSLKGPRHDLNVKLKTLFV